MARFKARGLSRPVDDLDFSDITSARRTGPARWSGENELEIPFDRPLTAAEETAVRRRVVATDDTEEQLYALLDAAISGNADFLALSSPTAAQNAAQVKALTRQVQALLRRLRRTLADREQ